jgi:hypothetical protein
MTTNDVGSAGADGEPDRDPTDPHAAAQEPVDQEPLDLEPPVKARSPRGTSATSIRRGPR